VLAGDVLVFFFVCVCKGRLAYIVYIIYILYIILYIFSVDIRGGLASSRGKRLSHTLVAEGLIHE
jgi:hypothetical protein